MVSRRVEAGCNASFLNREEWRGRLPKPRARKNAAGGKTWKWESEKSIAARCPGGAASAIPETRTLPHSRFLRVDPRGRMRCNE
jgi:hypothetical protein